jgi:hypothetical protein
MKFIRDFQKIIDRPAELKNLVRFFQHGMGPPLFATFSNGYMYGYFEGIACDVSHVDTEAVFPLIAKQYLFHCMANHVDSLACMPFPATLPQAKGACSAPCIRGSRRLLPRCLAHPSSPRVSLTPPSRPSLRSLTLRPSRQSGRCGQQCAC